MFGQRKSYWMDLGEVSSSVGNHSIIEPMFAQWIQSALFKKKKWIQSAHRKTLYEFEVLLSSIKGPAINDG
jgi:hypothetical protein